MSHIKIVVICSEMRRSSNYDRKIDDSNVALYLLVDYNMSFPDLLYQMLWKV